MRTRGGKEGTGQGVLYEFRDYAIGTLAAMVVVAPVDYFFVTGGISKNIGITRRIEKMIGFEAVKTTFDAQVAGALGAALFAHTLYLKEKKK